MPHQAESTSSNPLFERTRGNGSSSSSSVTTPFPSSAQVIPPTTATSSPPYPRSSIGALVGIDSSSYNYNNNHHQHQMHFQQQQQHPSMAWYHEYDSVHRVEPSPSSSKGYNRSHESLLTPRREEDDRHQSHSNITKKTTPPTTSYAQPTKAASVDSAEAAAASALLLASTEVSSDNNYCRKDATSSNGDAASDAYECPEGNVPLKKRKKHLDFLRRNQQPIPPQQQQQQEEQVYEASSVSQNGQPCHISPVSSSSIGSVANVDEQHPEETMSASSSSKEAVVVVSTAEQLELSESRADSYDHIKDAQPLPETAKINDSTDIRSSSSLGVSHFPSVLHEALTNLDFASVLQWLPHGEAWKVLRWDALRREVLPRCFPQLCEDDEKAYGSIDAFLLQVRIWGFEEIKDGPDVGAYRHEMFLREQPNLCQSMKLSSRGGGGEEANSPPRQQQPAVGVGHHQSLCNVASSPMTARAAGATAPSILRVPSLRVKADAGSSSGNNSVASKFSVSPITRPDSNKSYHHAVDTTPGNAEQRGPPSSKILLTPTPPTWPPTRPSESVAPSHTYRPDDSMAMYTDTWLPHPSGSSFLTRMPTSASCAPPNFDLRFSFRPSYNGSTESGYPHHQQQQRSNQPQYSSPQVRSGRGALRVATRNRSPHPCEQQPGRPTSGATSYPVSHRGRGVGSSVCRVPLQPADLSSSPPSYAQPTNPPSESYVVTESRTGPHDATIMTSFGSKDLDGGGGVRTNLMEAASAFRKGKRKLPMARKSVISETEP